jgi:hypothetical protein
LSLFTRIAVIENSEAEVCINFCGGCNPVINRGLLAGSVREYLGAHGIAYMYNQAESDIALWVSGCRVNCAPKSFPAGKTGISVAGESVDGYAVAEQGIAAEVIKKLMNLIDS